MSTPIRAKLAILADAAKYDASCASSGAAGRKAEKGGIGSTTGSGICHSYTPDGRCVSLLKVLLTNYCIYDCQYCINRRSSDVKRARFKVEEVVDLTLEFYKRNYIEGLFLSSGIIQNSDYTMEHLIRVAKTLRVDHGFQGYIHLKTIPEASPELIIEAGKWADRLSINVELPTQEGLNLLAPEKDLVQIQSSMGRIRDRIVENKEERREHKGRAKTPTAYAKGGQSTQMIVGADGASDSMILSTASILYSVQRLRRVYYSAYTPIPTSSVYLPPLSPPLLREHRLYQADWLIRFYGFNANELTDKTQPNLDLSVDPKLAWALNNRGEFPVDLNKASRESLLRIPGVGVRSVDRILAIRRQRSIKFNDLKMLKISLKRSLPFIVTHDHNPHTSLIDRVNLRGAVIELNSQLNLFDARVSSVTGEL